MPTPQEYYDDPDLYGTSQYVSFKDMMDGLLAEFQDDDHYLKNSKRSAMMRHLKNAIREIAPQAGNDIQSFEITVPETCYFPLPQDYLNYTMVSVSIRDPHTGGYRIYPLDINYNVNVAPGWLQDDQGNILFDGDGFILTADATNAYANPFQRYRYCSSHYNTCGGGYGFRDNNYHPRLDTSRLSKWGEVTIDPRRGYMLFSSDLAGKDIVFDYISDGLKEYSNEITVHKFIRKPIEEMAYFLSIERKRNIPANEKERARQAYKGSLHKAKMKMADFDMNRIARVLRINTRTP